MAKLVIHADDCPALSENLPRGSDWSGGCACTAEADLTELVAAAEDELKRDSLAEWNRLDAALKPFREEKPK